MNSIGDDSRLNPWRFTSRDNQTISVRHAVTKDAENLFEGFNEVVSEGSWLPTFKPNAHVGDWVHWIHKTQHTREVLLVAEVDGEYAGHLTLQTEDWMASRHVARLGVIVITKYRCIGVGRALMLSAEKVALAEEYEKIVLSTFANNAIALSLYDTLEYRIVGVRRSHFKMPKGYIDEVLLEKELVNPSD